jgi:hypothetical protein
MQKKEKVERVKARGLEGALMEGTSIRGAYDAPEQNLAGARVVLSIFILGE